MEAAAAVAPQCSVREGKAETWGFLNCHYFTQVKSYILRISRIKWKKKSVWLLGLRLGVSVHIRMNLPTLCKKDPGGAEERSEMDVRAKTVLNPDRYSHLRPLLPGKEQKDPAC